MMADDMSLAREYARGNSEVAFANLVSRHINLVYSVALRRVGDPHLAEEITQAVFILLARKAKSLNAKTVLSAWLCRTARYIAADALKMQRRRQFREQEAHMQSTLNEPETDVWQQIAPLLDEALNCLGEKEHDAVVLRFFDGKDLKNVGAVLGMGEDAARMRVNRGVEKLRRFFIQRGLTLSAAVIAGTIRANSVQAAPMPLAKSVTVLALAKGAAVGGSTSTLIQGALKIMAWSKAKMTVATAVILLCAGGWGVYIYHSTRSPTAKAAAELQRALYHDPLQKNGVRGYPSPEVAFAILHFGSERKRAFPILEKAARSSNSEARKLAICGMGLVGRSEMLPMGPLGDPAPEAAPFLWRILSARDAELSDFALNSLRNIGFQPKDIPTLVDLLVQCHAGDQNPNTLGAASASEAQHLSDHFNANNLLIRYLPEAIAETIQKNPEAAAPFISPVEILLDDENTDIRFEAACALAKYKGVHDHKIYDELLAGLKTKDDTAHPFLTLKHLMAIETLEKIGSEAKPMLPPLIDFANSTPDYVSRDVAFKAIGAIDPDLRNTMPEVARVFNDGIRPRQPAEAPHGGK